MGIEPTPEEMVEVFGDDHASKQAEYAAEAEARWSDTDAWKQSRRRTTSYSKDDWEQAKAEGEAAARRILAAKQAGLPPESEEAMAGAEAHRLHIDRWFYPCSHEMQRGLADMYTADPRFTKTYEDIGGEGFAQFVRDAIHANADLRTS